jgi:CcmD family protein
MSKKMLLAALLVGFRLTALAQEKEVEMADTMRSNGRIYVVVAVVLAIFTGIIIYLIRLDRKISRLEKNIHS